MIIAEMLKTGVKICSNGETFSPLLQPQRLLGLSFSSLPRIHSPCYTYSMAGVVYRFRLFGIIALPAILIGIEGWGYMGRFYTGLHKFEWGYLLASILAGLLWASLWIDKPHNTHQKNKDTHTPTDASALALVVATAFGIAVNAWFFEFRIWNITYWYLPLLFCIFAMSNHALQRKENRYSRLTDRLSLRLAFLALLLLILVHFASNISTYQDIFSENHQISGYLSPETRAVVLGSVNPMFFTGLALIALATAISALNTAILILSDVSRLQAVFDTPLLSKLLIIVLLPLFYFVRALIGNEQDFIVGFSIIDIQLVVFLILIVLSLPIFVREAFQLRRGSANQRKRNLVSSILLMVAAYSFTPFISSTLGNIEYSLFWMMIIFVAIALVWDQEAGGRSSGQIRTTAIGKLLTYFALVVAFFSEFVHNTGPNIDELGGHDSTFRATQAVLRGWHDEFFLFAVFLASIAALVFIANLVLKRRYSTFTASVS